MKVQGSFTVGSVDDMQDVGVDSERTSNAANDTPKKDGRDERKTRGQSIPIIKISTG
jgi:hypothetical protein